MILDPKVVHIAVEREIPVLCAGNRLEIRRQQWWVRERRLAVLRTVKIERDEVIRMVKSPQQIVPLPINEGHRWLELADVSVRPALAAID